MNNAQKDLTSLVIINRHGVGMAENGPIGKMCDKSDESGLLVVDNICQSVSNFDSLIISDAFYGKVTANMLKIRVNLA